MLDERYPFFARRGVDWHAMWARHEPRLAAAASTEEWKAAARPLFAELGDGHTSLAGQIVFGPRARTLVRSLGTGAACEGIACAAERAAGYVDDVSVDELGIDPAIGVRFGTLPGGAGYLRVDSMAADPQKTLIQVDRALAALSPRRGIVLDLRLNGGGSDLLANQVAGRFTAESYHAYTKHAGSASRATRQAVRVEPSGAARFTGPVAVLVGPLTASAAENLTLALRGRAARTVVVGETTTGELSDIIPWFLPNGVELGIGMEVYEDRSGVVYEVAGIAPDRIVRFDPLRGDPQAPIEASAKALM